MLSTNPQHFFLQAYLQKSAVSGQAVVAGAVLGGGLGNAGSVLYDAVKKRPIDARRLVIMHLLGMVVGGGAGAAISELTKPATSMQDDLKGIANRQDASGFNTAGSVPNTPKSASAPATTPTTKDK